MVHGGGGWQPDAGCGRVRGNNQGGHMGQPPPVLPHDVRWGGGWGRGRNRRRGSGGRGTCVKIKIIRFFLKNFFE